MNEPDKLIKVLLVDDKKENLYSLQNLLETDNENITFLKVTSGEEALKVALQEELAMILLDVQMPGMDGYEVAANLKKSVRTRTIPIIFVTALNYESGYIEKGYQYGAVDYLFKPLNSAITRAKVNAFIQFYLQKKELEMKNAELENLALLVNNTQDLMCILDAQTLQFVAVNPACEAEFSLRKEVFYRKSPSELNFLSQQLCNMLSRAVENKLEFVSFEDLIHKSDNKPNWYSWSFVLKKGKWYGNGKNITEKKIAEEALSKANQELEQKVQERTLELRKANADLKKEVDRRARAESEMKSFSERLIKTNEELDNFVYTASHDLKLPIANMEGLVHSLSEEIGESQGEVRNMTEMLNHSVAQLKTTVQDLLNIIKKQKSGNVNDEESDCGSILEEIEFSIHEMIAESGARIYSNLECKTIRINKADLKSLLYNLISNAIKYKDEKRIPEIIVSVRKTEEHTIIAVSDNGIGISKENQSKLFSMFKRINEKVEGTGIGLYLVKRIVDKYGGFIKVQSELGEGTEFKIFFNN